MSDALRVAVELLITVVGHGEIISSSCSLRGKIAACTAVDG